MQQRLKELAIRKVNDAHESQLFGMLSWGLKEDFLTPFGYRKIFKTLTESGYRSIYMRIWRILGSLFGLMAVGV